jgi:hypothetical protein
VDIEDDSRVQLIFRCGACGYQTWAANSPGACPACGGADFTGATPVEWRRRLQEPSGLGVEVGADATV